jgi:hypothetical protein
MPRRPPPTRLRLLPATAPLPGRGVPKHPLPTMPCPTFLLPATTEAVQKPRVRSRTPSVDLGFSPAGTPEAERASPLSTWAPPSVFAEPASPPSYGKKKVRGPWDHSGSISLQFDVSTLLAPPKRAAVSP